MEDRGGFVGVCEDGCCFIAHQSILLPAFPEFDNYVEEFIRATVAFVSFGMRLTAEHHGCYRVSRCDRVPAHTSSGQMICCGKASGHVIGLVVGGRSCSHEANPTGYGRHEG